MGGNLSPLGRMTHSDLEEKVRVILRIFMLQKTERLGCHYCCPEAQDVQEGCFSGICSCCASFPITSSVTEGNCMEPGNELCPVLITSPTVMLSWEIRSFGTLDTWLPIHGEGAG